MVDYPDEKPFETMLLLLDTLSSESPSLSFEEGINYTSAVNEDYQAFNGKVQALYGS